ncbi:hypothetical protein PIB30_087054 [Stylosanthes scabra]|uniref:Uncharacterized protein n=1 Tax=Stylosanthes scabra TaxID=79078 RepID=A0ABU6RTR5_9FABA|nr:hypothetical protein [Stylosanthes scabra]
MRVQNIQSEAYNHKHRRENWRRGRDEGRRKKNLDESAPKLEDQLRRFTDLKEEHEKAQAAQRTSKNIDDFKVVASAARRRHGAVSGGGRVAERRGRERRSRERRSHDAVDRGTRRRDTGTGGDGLVAVCRK